MNLTREMVHGQPDFFHMMKAQGLWTRGGQWMSFTLTSASLLTCFSIK